MTDAHVVRPFGEASITLADGRMLDGAKVVGSDLEADLAVLELPTPVAFPDAVAGDPAALRRDERVFLVGYPKADVEQPTSTITEGIIAAEPLEWRDELTYLAIDAAIDDGQSGGVMADAEGRLLGSRAARVVNLAVALAIDDAVCAPRRSSMAGTSTACRTGCPGPDQRTRRRTSRRRSRTARTRRSGSSPVARMMVRDGSTMAGDGPALLYAMAAGGQLSNSAGPAGERQTVAIDFRPPGPYLVKVETTGARPVAVDLHATLGLTPLDDPGRRRDDRGRRPPRWSGRLRGRPRLVPPSTRRGRAGRHPVELVVPRHRVVRRRRRHRSDARPGDGLGRSVGRRRRGDVPGTRGRGVPHRRQRRRVHRVRRATVSRSSPPASDRYRTRSRAPRSVARGLAQRALEAWRGAFVEQPLEVLAGIRDGSRRRGC